MGVRVLVGAYDGEEQRRACLVDSVSGFAFGPLLDDEEHADRMLAHLAEHGRDARLASDAELDQAASATRGERE